MVATVAAFVGVALSCGKVGAAFSANFVDDSKGQKKRTTEIMVCNDGRAAFDWPYVEDLAKEKTIKNNPYDGTWIARALLAARRDGEAAAKKEASATLPASGKKEWHITGDRCDISTATAGLHAQGADTTTIPGVTLSSGCHVVRNAEPPHN